MSKVLIDLLRYRAVATSELKDAEAFEKAVDTIERLQAERDGLEGVNKILQVKYERLQARLEVTPDHPFDGIDFRDQAIAMRVERIAALEAENAELIHDRARYNILRDDPEFTVTHQGRELSHEYLDQAVDAVRATSSPGTSAPPQPEECQSPGKTVRSAK